MLGELHGLQLVEALAYGESSVVYLAHDDAGFPFALKRIVRRAGEDDRRLAQADREHDVASLLRHPGLRQSYARWRTPRFGATREVTLQLEYLEGPSLADAPPTDLAEAARLLRPIASALAALHGAGLVHGDIKPSNILRHDGGARLIDYGLCGPVAERPPRVMGTPATMAPEQRTRAPRTVATDVYGLAATLRMMLGEHALPPLVTDGLATRPGDRPSLAELIAALDVPD